METSGLSGVAAAQFAVDVAKISQNQEKQKGQAAVALIEGAAVPPVSPDGKGNTINTYA